MHRITLSLLLPAVCPWATAKGQLPQNPSPMVEHTRAHPRLEKAEPAGERRVLSLGTLFVPSALADAEEAGLLVHFHGGTWIPELAAERSVVVSLAVQLGAGSGRYAAPFRETGRFAALLAEAEDEAGLRFKAVTVSGWSAGCGALREIFKDPANDARVVRALFLDGIHSGYLGDGAGREVEPEPLASIARWGRRAMAGEVEMLVVHSTVFPGTYASTTETADWLVRELGLKRRAVLGWGPMGTQQLSEVREGAFTLLGYAGNSAPDHVDLLHALPDFLEGHLATPTPDGLGEDGR